MMTPRKSSSESAPQEKPARRRSKKTAEEMPPAEPSAPLAAADTDAAVPESSERESAVPDVEQAVLRPVDKMVAFLLGGQRYALPIDSVQEIQQIVAFSEVPSRGSAVVGMVNLRGTVIPAVDLRHVLGLAVTEYTLETPMVICRRSGQLVALIVDEVEDVLDVPEDCLQPPPAMHALADRMIGVCRFDTELTYLLDVERLLAPLDMNR